MTKFPSSAGNLSLSSFLQSNFLNEFSIIAVFIFSPLTIKHTSVWFLLWIFHNKCFHWRYHGLSWTLSRFHSDLSHQDLMLVTSLSLRHSLLGLQNPFSPEFKMLLFSDSSPSLSCLQSLLSDLSRSLIQLQWPCMCAGYSKIHIHTPLLISDPSSIPSCFFPLGFHMHLKLEISK